MIVSSRIDSFNALRGAKHVKIAVQRNKNDSGEPEPADYQLPYQVPCFTQAHTKYHPVGTTANRALPDVPLKCDQYGSHAVGAALLNAPNPPWTAPLDIESEMPKLEKSHIIHPASFGADIRRVPHFPYEEGIRGGNIPIKFDTVSEPTPAMFRRDYTPQRNYAPPHINYDLGVEELRQMATKHL